jgi:hypothetical protein
MSTFFREFHKGKRRRRERGGGVYFPRTVRSVFFVLLCLIVIAGELNASEETSHSIQLLSSSHRVVLDPLKPEELLHDLEFSTGTVDLDTLTTSVRGDGGVDRVDSPLRGKRISRAVSSVWTVRIPASMHPNSLKVDYTVNSCSDKKNYLSAQEKPDSRIRVSVNSLRPTILSRDPLTDTIVVEGGAILRLSPVHVKYAGTYCGRLSFAIYAR